MHPIMRSMLQHKEHPVAKVERLQIKRWWSYKKRKTGEQKAGRIQTFDSVECALLNIHGTFVHE